MPCKEEEDKVSGSTFGGTPKVMFFWIRHKNIRDKRVICLGFRVYGLVIGYWHTVI